ncbi:hypothetical protein TUMEXPCC7403_10375 [Tumidithrix helvetica PCC 7403]|uniref:beta strand repeat-containing protein n=1 Tax=Tumidithrix helvetica TaxID=3457545 RepID=UPI003C85A0D2
MAFSIDIDFDYFYQLNPSPLFDPSTPDGQKARATVVKAANDWAQYIASDFIDVPQGTNVKVANTGDIDFPNPNNQSTITLSTPIQDIRIFIGTRTRDRNDINIAQTATGDVLKPQNISSTDNNDYDFWNAARNGINRQPAVGSITFSSTKLFQVDYSKPVNDSQYDLYTVALHEIFHILAAERNGFLSNKPALAYDVNLKTGTTFLGSNVTSVVPLANGRKITSATDSHFVPGTTSPPVGGGNPLIPELLVPSYPPGSRKVISQLDLAVLADVGYKIINAGFTPTSISLTAPVPLLLVSGYSIAGTPDADIINGNIGDDTLAGGPGNDALSGGDGNDNLYGGIGNDTMTGGLGDDTYYVDSIDDKVTEQASEGNDTIVVKALSGNLSVFNFFVDPANRQNVEQIIDLTNKKLALSGGNNNTDTNAIISLYSSDKNGWEVTTFPGGNDDIKTKGLGNTTVSAGDGNDTIFGGDGNDRLSGDAGDDILVGGSGSDTIFGGSSSGFNTLVGFDIGSTTGTPILTPNQVDTLTHSSNSSNIFVLSSGGVNAYTAGNDYARIVGWTSQSTNPAKFDRLKVAPGTTVVNGVDQFGQTALNIRDPSGEVIAHLVGETTSSFSTSSFVFDNDVNIFPLTETITENAPSGSAFRISRAGSTTSALTVNYTISTGLGQAAQGPDYNANFTGSITIAAGSAFVDLPLSLINDFIIEDIEDISLNLTPSGSYSLGILSEAILSIIDDDRVNLSVNTTTASENGQTVITLTATNSGTVVGDQTVDIFYSGTGIDANDFTGTIPTQITILNGQTTGSVSFVVNYDTITEGTEIATFTIDNPTIGIALGSTTSQTVSISDSRLKMNVNGTSGNDTFTLGTNPALFQYQPGDSVFGLAGDDTYAIDTNYPVQIFENAGAAWGIDTVQSLVSFNLQYTPNVENLTLTGSSNIEGRGNTSSNVIIGNSGNNLLTASTNAADGQVDILQGGVGNDTYYVYEDYNLDKAIDTVGTNLIYAYNTNYDMGGTTADLVDIRLYQGTGIIGGGTSTANYISGNAQANILRGYGGNDTIAGGAGNDFIDGGAGNDALAGNNLGPTSITEQDTLKGGTGADAFVLGYGTSIFYLGGGANDFTSIQDFNPTAEGDRIYLGGGPSGGYTLNNLSGGNYDLLRTSGADLIAKITVTDGSALTLSSSFFG